MRIHVTGIGGTGMGNLAVLLKMLGHHVRGSDSGIYPPMDGILRQARIPVMEGYHPSNLDPLPDLVVVGNVCRPDHPEARAAICRAIPVASLPGVLAGLVLRNRRSLVVAGTHGKTTTSAMVVHLLESAGLAPGYLVGGRILSSASGTAPGRGRWFVLEGDEYDSAFFEKRAKFLGYEAHGLILTSVEHDHVDIYPTWDSYRWAFGRLVTGLPASGLLVACADHPQVERIASRAPCPVLTYTASDDVQADYRATDVHAGQSETTFTLLAHEERNMGTFRLPATGLYNVANAVAALAMCSVHAGVDMDVLGDALARFPGVARRQHLAGTPGGVRVLDDFGHHPTAVAETLEGIRQGMPEGARILAVLRPASATACRSLHQDRWPRALARAQMSILAPLARTSIPAHERLDLARVASDVQILGSQALLAPSLDRIPQMVNAWARPGDTVVFFSNSDTADLLARTLRTLAPQ